MKKTISFNISGTIFHIEEDGYDKLKSYLTSIQRYFAGYEDSQEIVTDIENRVAEKLLAKLKADGKQVISLDDINELIHAMGTVEDFEAVEDENLFATQSKVTTSAAAGNATFGRSADAGATSAGQSATYQEAPGAGTSQPQQTATFPNDQPRRFYRDLRRKTLGGVASGLAHYFRIDPVWVRLILVALFFGSAPLIDNGGISGITLLAYIAMWIAFPGSMTLEDDRSLKKFFRNPDDQVLGGVASGLAQYFGFDTGVIRLLFVVSIVFFGVGLLGYIVLWIISPPARTVTEKMEMQGRPITLSNIERSIKSGINEPINAPESALTRVLLFPFRIISTVLSGLGRALGPFLGGIMAVVRVFAGVLLLICAFAGIVACLSAGGFALGMNTADFGSDNMMFQMFRQEVDTPIVLAALVSGLLPCIWLGLVGLWLITLRWSINRRTGLTLLAVQVVAFLVVMATVPPLVNGFRRSGTVETERPLNVAVGTPTFDIQDVDTDYDNRPSLRIQGYEGTTLKLVEMRRAQGRSRVDAERNARTIQYNVATRDSVIRFDDGIDLTPNSRFRAQDLDLTLYVPYERPFRMTEAFARYVSNEEFGGKELDRMKQSLWKYTKDDQLVSLNFPRERPDYRNEESSVDLGDDADVNVETSGSNRQQFTVTSFENVDVSGHFAVRFVKGDKYNVVADSDEADKLNDVTVKVEGNTLKVGRDNAKFFDFDDEKRIGITITTPAVREVRLAGASNAVLSGFGKQPALGLTVAGACKLLADVEVDRLTVDVAGASKAVLRGRTDRLNADIAGASKLDAVGLTAREADVDAAGASKADMGTVTKLNSNASGASRINSPNTTSSDSEE